MPDLQDKTFIASILFLDIVGYSKRPVEEQIEIKHQFNALLTTAIKDIPREDRIVLDTGDGAALCFITSPEVALQVALHIRQQHAHQTTGVGPVYRLCTGINLGPVRVVEDLNQQRNVVGDGINAAQRILAIAEAGEILVSRAFHDIVAFLTTDHMNMFRSRGKHQDKHGRKHEVYQVLPGFGPSRLMPKPTATSEPASFKDDRQDQDRRGSARLPDDVLLRVEQEYARYVGPIAHQLVRRVIGRSTTREELCSTLKEVISSDTERKHFEQFFCKETAISLTPDNTPAAGAGTVDPGATHAQGGNRRLSQEQLSLIEQALAKHIGPIAKVLIRRQAINASTPLSLCIVLAQHIDSEENQKQFLQEVKPVTS
jgi:class 3 adenylate cyclase